MPPVRDLSLMWQRTRIISYPVVAKSCRGKDCISTWQAIDTVVPQYAQIFVTGGYGRRTTIKEQNVDTTFTQRSPPKEKRHYSPPYLGTSLQLIRICKNLGPKSSQITGHIIHVLYGSLFLRVHQEWLSSCDVHQIVVENQWGANPKKVFVRIRTLAVPSEW